MILSILGPTAVGKTQFAFDLIDVIPAEAGIQGFDIISADSRQVYRDIPVISGADLDDKWQIVNGEYFKKDNVKVYGVSILEANEDWSVAHFVDFARKIIKSSLKNNRLVLVVGGTGLYHQQLFEPSESLGIKPDKKLREKLDKLSLEDLQKKLKKLDLNKFESLNNSDKNNPRRLVRAIEIVSSPSPRLADGRGGQACPPSRGSGAGVGVRLKVERVCLVDSLQNIQSKIKTRVEQRFEGGVKEVGKLRLKNRGTRAKHDTRQGISPQLLSATGVQEIWDYLDAKLSKQECLEKWALREFQYAKRQLTWLKKYHQGEFCDVNSQVATHNAILDLCGQLKKPIIR